MQDMFFEVNMVDIINLSKNTTHPIISLFMISFETNEISDNLKDWTIEKVGPRLINMILYFTVPLNVSQGDEADELII